MDASGPPPSPLVLSLSSVSVLLPSHGPAPGPRPPVRTLLLYFLCRHTGVHDCTYCGPHTRGQRQKDGTTTGSAHIVYIPLKCCQFDCGNMSTATVTLLGCFVLAAPQKPHLRPFFPLVLSCPASGALTDIHPFLYLFFRGALRMFGGRRRRHRGSTKTGNAVHYYTRYFPIYWVP